MNSQEKNNPEIRFLTTPKWLTPFALLLAVFMIAFSIYKTDNNWAFGKLFPFLSTNAEGIIDVLPYVKGPECMVYYLGPQRVSYSCESGTKWKLNKDLQREGFSYDDQYIRRHEDTSWVVGDDGDVHDAMCDDGSRAGNAIMDRSPEGDEKPWDVGFNWIPRFIPKTGAVFSNSGTLVAINASTGDICNLAGDDNRFVGGFGSTLQITFHDTYTFDCDPANPETLSDIMEVSNAGGAGAGDHIFYQKGVGMVAYKLTNGGGQTTFFTQIGGCFQGNSPNKTVNERYQCTINQLTKLIPTERSYEITTDGKNSGLLLKNGVGKAHGRMSIKEVTVAGFIQSGDIENSSLTSVPSDAAVQINDVAHDVNDVLSSNYPADGKFYSRVGGVKIESWLDESCAETNPWNQRAPEKSLWPYQPIDTSWPCQEEDDLGSTGYVETQELLIRKAGYVYYPLGSALGAVVKDPLNYFYLYEEPTDFKAEPTPYMLEFLSNQSAAIKYHPNAIQSMIDYLGSSLKGILKKIGLITFLDNRLAEINEVTPTGQASKAYVKDDGLSGETGIDIGEITYCTDCKKLNDLIKKYDDDVIPGISRRSETCDYPASCLDESGSVIFKTSACKEVCTSDAEMKALLAEAVAAREKLKILYDQCQGEKSRNLTAVAFNGSLSLEAPFVPILAHERYEDVTYTTKPVCEEAEDGLFSGKVTAEISWYDTNIGGATGLGYQVSTENKLQNGSFEERGGSAGGTASGPGANGWSFIWKKNYDPGVDTDDYQSDICNSTEGQSNLYYCRAPEFKGSDNVLDRRRVLDGALSSQWFTTFNTHDVIAYQVVDNASSGDKLSGYFQGWRNHTGEDGGDSNGCVISNVGYVGGSIAEICVYYGDLFNDIVSKGNNHEIEMGRYEDIVRKISANGSCSQIDKGAFMNEWKGASVQLTKGGKVTVVLRSTAQIPARNTDDYWDAISLGSSNSFITTNLSVAPKKMERAFKDECRLFNEVQQVCELSVDGGVGEESGLIASENVEFYVPGLGAIPYIRTRLSVGKAKSPDNIAKDMNYCENREPSRVKELFNISSEAEVEVYKNFSVLDVYIMQNLQPRSLAISWAQAIAPNVSKKDIEAIIDDVQIPRGNDGSPGNSVIIIPEGYDRGAIDQEKDIMNACKAAGIDKLECAYVIATAKFESGLNPSRSEGGCSCPAGCTTLSNGNQRLYGKPDANGKCYYGRGYVQLTWKSNYVTMQNIVPIEGLVENPDLALEPMNSAKILMQYFIGRGIKSNIDSQSNYIEARSMVNGDTDHKCTRSDCNGTETVGQHVAGIAIAYLEGGVMEDY